MERPKKLTDWAQLRIRQVRRWLPEQTLVVVMDSSYAVLELVAVVSAYITPSSS